MDLLEGTPQIRNPDSDSPKGMHPQKVFENIIELINQFDSIGYFL